MNTYLKFIIEVLINIVLFIYSKYCTTIQKNQMFLDILKEHSYDFDQNTFFSFLMFIMQQKT